MCSLYILWDLQKKGKHTLTPPPKKKLHFFCLCIGVLGMLLRVMLCWFNMVWNHCSPPQTDFYLVSNWQYFVMLGTYVQLKPVVLSGHIFFIRTTDTHSYQQTLWPQSENKKKSFLNWLSVAIMYALHCTEGLLIILTAEDESEELIVPGSLCNGPLKKVTPN